MAEPEDLKDQFNSVGTLCAQWSYLEHLCEVTIWAFLRLSEQEGKIVTDGLGIGNRITMIRNLVGHHKPKDADSLIGTVDWLERTIADRNLIVHGMWHSDPSKGETWLTISRGKYVGKREPLTTERLLALNATLFTIIENFEAILKSHGIITVERR